MSELVDRLREAREGMNDVAVIAPDQDVEDKLTRASELVGDAIEEIEKLEGELVRLETGVAPGIQFAKVISVKRDGGRGPSLRIDGLEFPWYVHEDGVSVGRIRKDDVPRVLVPIIAERVEVIDSIDTVPATLEDEPVDAGVTEDAGRREGEGERLEEEPGIVRPPGPPAPPDVPDDRPGA